MRMIYISVILGLFGIIAFQYYRRKRRNQELNYLTQKMKEICEHELENRIRIVTSDPYIQKLAVSCNLVLDENAKHAREYRQSQESMKKMLANVSHDLKTPLTVVLGYLEMMKEKKSSDHMDTIHEKVKDVLRMMNEFFDLAKLESKDKTYPLEWVEVTEIGRQAVLSHYETLLKKQIEVQITIPETQIKIKSNQEAIARILHNLISNAIRYGMDGKYFGFTIKEEEEEVVFQVIDRGKGIEKQYQEKVFERLYTLEDSRSMNYQGSGLGLTITKALAQAIHGFITLESEPYVCTIFSLHVRKK